MVTIVIPTVRLTFVVFFQLWASSWALFSEEWMEASYQYTSLCVFIVGVWALHDKHEPGSAGFYACALMFSIFNDILALSVYTTDARVWETDPDSTRHHKKFSFACAMVLLLLKPLMVFYAYQEFVRRGGEFVLSVQVLIEDEDGNVAASAGAGSGGSADGSRYQSIEDDGPKGDDDKDAANKV